MFYLSFSSKCCVLLQQDTETCVNFQSVFFGLIRLEGCVKSLLFEEHKFPGKLAILVSAEPVKNIFSPCMTSVSNSCK